MKAEKNIILNVSYIKTTQEGSPKNGKVLFDVLKTKKLIAANAKINSYIEPVGWDLNPQYSYKIVGGSSNTGSPMRSYVNCYNAVKQRLASRKKPLRVVSHKVTSFTRVLDVIARKRH